MTVRHSLLLACLALVAACDKSDPKSAADDRDRGETTDDMARDDESSKDETTPDADTTASTGTTTTGTTGTTGTTDTTASTGTMPGSTIPGAPAATNGTEPATAGATTTADASATKPNDAQIAKMLSTVNNAEVEAGKLAKSKSKNAAVQSFAQMMIDEHGAAEQKLQPLAAKLGTAADHPEVTSLKQETDATAARLKGLEGAAFDKAYADAMVEGHADVLAMIDGALLPNATNLEVKSMLTETRARVATHHEHAKKLQTQVSAAPTN
jgi:putative membrane protein